MSETALQFPAEWHGLFHAALNDSLDEASAATLADLLRTDPRARELWFLYHDNECNLHESAAVMPTLQTRATLQTADRGADWRYPRRAWVAAAAGMLIGVGFASLAWAIVGPFSPRGTLLMQEGFESGSPPTVAGPPREAGTWGGDFAEISGARQGIAPADGTHMLRFLRGDSQSAPNDSAHSSDVFRLVDVRGHRAALAAGTAVVQLSALFNGVPVEADDPLFCTLTVFALRDGDATSSDLILSRDSLAYSHSSRVRLDDDPISWQRVSNELRVPSNADYLMLRIGVSYDARRNRLRADAPPSRAEPFAGHFADYVQLVLAQRPEIAVP